MKTSNCPRCGQRLPQDAPEGLCAACLIEAGAETLTAGSAEDSTAIPPGGPRLKSGETLGPYRVGRLLGRGGMGEVYECEQVESGRRVALKVLRDRLENADQRGRFLREGQLAASISHPHTVYIFGTEEISGMPVISMELLPGGTLKDRVSKDGPLPPSEAVSAILDIIGGLDAAQAAGILHRDASAIVTPKLVEMRAELAKVMPGPIGGAVLVMEILLALTLIVAFVCGIVSAAIVPGGIVLRSLGLAVVSSTGREISRFRSVPRALIAWLPIPVFVALILGKSRPGVLVIAPPPQAVAAGLLAVLVIGVIWAIVQPTRGLHDRIVRTWITSR